MDGHPKYSVTLPNIEHDESSTHLRFFGADKQIPTDLNPKPTDSEKTSTAIKKKPTGSSSVSSGLKESTDVLRRETEGFTQLADGLEEEIVGSELKRPEGAERRPLGLNNNPTGARFDQGDLRRE